MKVFITGITGYLGGSLACHFHKNGAHITGLVRGEARTQALEAAGFKVVVGDLEDGRLLSATAAQADVVINAASSDNTVAAAALIEGLLDTGKTLIHTSGSSLIADDARGDTCAITAGHRQSYCHHHHRPDPDYADYYSFHIIGRLFCRGCRRHQYPDTDPGAHRHWSRYGSGAFRDCFHHDPGDRRSNAAVRHGTVRDNQNCQCAVCFCRQVQFDIPVGDRRGCVARLAVSATGSLAPSRFQVACWLTPLLCSVLMQGLRGRGAS